jgi:subtilisin-like proprotein convertase family protein
MPAGYCTSGATSSGGSIVSLVTLNGEAGHNINNNTTGACASYNNYTALPEAWLSPTNYYTITVGMGTCDATNNMKRGKVYIDYTRDGDFFDFGEEVACFGTNTTPQNYNITFQVPSTASFGYTLMRVICYEDALPYCTEFDACTLFPIGETEDYRVAIQDDIGLCLEPLDILDLDPRQCGDGTIDIFNATPLGGVFSGPGVSSNTGTLGSTFTGPLGIPDNTPGGANATLNVSGLPLVTSGYDVWLESVQFDVTHTWVGDLKITLTSPNGVPIVLTDRPGVPESTFGCSSDDISATVVGGNDGQFYRNMDGECIVSAPGVTGTFRAMDPDNLDNVNDGSDLNGDWILNVEDLALGDIGTIDNYTLNFGWQEGIFDPIAAGLGFHEVVYEHTDLFGMTCEVRDTVEVYFPDVEIKIKQGADSMCFGDTLSLEATIAGSFGGEITLLTTLAGGNGQNGNMFDLDAINDVVILSFDGNQLGSGGPPFTFEIYWKPGTHQGFETNAGAWTMIGQATGVPMNPQGTATPIPIPVNVPINAGNRAAFYVTATTGFNVAYTNGTVLGNQYASDANIIFYEGVGMSYPFGTVFTPRIFNGIIHYAIASSDTTSTYLWNTGDTTAVITLVPTATFDYIVQVTDSNGCVGSDTMRIWINDEIIIDAPDVDICYGYSTTLGGAPTASGGSGLFQYQWSPSTNLSCTTCPNPVANPAFTTTYLLEIVDSFNCYVSKNVTVTVNLNPEASAGAPQAICPGNSAPIGGSPTGSQGTPPYTYAWLPAAGLDNATAANPNASPAATTVYTVTVTDANGCTATDSVVVVVYPEPDPTITTTGPYCENGGNVQLTAATPGGTWSGTAVSPSGMFDPAAAGPGFHQVIYTVTNGVGCTASDTVSIQVYPAPVAAVTSATDFCDNQGNVFLTGTPVGGTWSGNGIVNASTGEFDPALAGTGTHAIVYAYTDANGCTDTDTSFVTVHAAPDATIAPAGPFCENAGPQQLTAATPGGTWTGTGVSITGLFDPAVAGAGSHTVNYSVTDANGCTDADTAVITVLAAPAAGITAAGPFCANESAVNLTATPAQGTNYWSGPGIIDPLTGLFDPASAGPGSHMVTVSKTYANGCVVTATITITVNPLPDATITDPGPMCANGPAISLSAATPGGTWTGTGITNPTTGTFDPSVAGAGTHTIIYTVTDANGCSGSDDVDIVVTPAVVITAVVTDVGCNTGNDGGIDITITGGTPPFTYAWSNGASTQDIQKLAIGTYTVTVTDLNGCTATGSFTVNEPPPITINPVVVADATTPQFSNGSIDITPAGGTPPYTFIWSNGETTEDVSNLQADTYRVTVIDANGCRYDFFVTVNAIFGLGISATDLNDGMLLYPNPTDGLIHFTLDLGVSAEVNMTMVDVLGRIVYTNTGFMVNTYSEDIDMSEWASGQYILHVQVGDVAVYRKVVLTK